MIIYIFYAGYVQEKYPQVAYTQLNRDLTQKCCEARREIWKWRATENTNSRMHVYTKTFTVYVLYMQLCIIIYICAMFNRYV